MSTYAVFQTGGKQYKVSTGDTVRVESLQVPASGKIDINDVLLHSENGELTIGSPLIAGASISAKLIQNGRHKKIRVFHYKHKTRLRKTFGHRQNFTEIEITAISLKPEAEKTTAKKTTAKKTTAKKTTAKKTTAKKTTAKKTTAKK